MSDPRQESVPQAAGEPIEATGTMDRQVWGALREVVDPELGINIVDLGLVYDVTVEDEMVRVAVTMTTPACPLHSYVLDAIHFSVRRDVPWVREVDVRLVWDPPWHPDMMSAEAKRQLGWEG
ncbi:MAG: metal-sulfur cluster assembly factor [Armatimonadota bacterium]|nr:metal-sulfur cluster assembly factor [Armatimonadota bacterium]MDR7392964.1 metal-sulfur cluster assembly factor [Armatimonadota bacterium]MDR7397998.1 metal-sulfur cluster assembly factor [Armatimonadota bacterium]MDR7406323.1 metal-sulfur cluster assembly factor [Armatimonadota bacterium]MDR7408462.1 metal-sulfur cluster assembly factor [Armatimonadota bacterium]